MQFFSLISFFFFVIAIAISIPVFQTYFATGLVPRLPTAILATTLMLLSVPVADVGSHPGYGHTRAARTEAAHLSFLSGSGQRPLIYA